MICVFLWIFKIVETKYYSLFPERKKIIILVRSQKSTTLPIIITQAAYLFLFNQNSNVKYLLMFSFIVVKDSKSKTKSYFLKYKYIVYDRHHQVFFKMKSNDKISSNFFQKSTKNQDKLDTNGTNIFILLK